MSEARSAADKLRESASRETVAEVAAHEKKSARGEGAGYEPSPSEERLRLTRLVAYYEIAGKAGLADDPALVNQPAFIEARERYRKLEEKLGEIFPGDTLKNYIQFHVEGSLTREGKTYEDVWREFGPPELKKYPLPPGSIF